MGIQAEIERLQQLRATIVPPEDSPEEKPKFVNRFFLKVRMEPTIGLEPMTCRLRIRCGESFPANPIYSEYQNRM